MSIGIFELVALGAAPTSDDVLVLVNVHNSAQSPQGSTQKMTVGNLFTSPNLSNPTSTGVLTFAGGTVVASAPPINLTQTWNNGAIVFRAIAVNITSTASDGNSLLIDLSVGGTSQFKVTRVGTATLVGGLTVGNALDVMTAGIGSNIQSSDSTSFAAATFAADGGSITAKIGADIASTGIVTGAATGDLVIVAVSKDIRLSIDSGATTAVRVTSSNAVITTGTVTTGDTFLNRTSGTYADASGAVTGTLTNSPLVGNPTKWLKVIDGSHTYAIPGWQIA